MARCIPTARRVNPSAATSLFGKGQLKQKGHAAAVAFLGAGRLSGPCAGRPHAPAGVLQSACRPCTALTRRLGPRQRQAARQAGTKA